LVVEPLGRRLLGVYLAFGYFGLCMLAAIGNMHVSI
jgi:hypothetical protein